MNSKAIPVVDLFAGPGGLGEGFSSILSEDGNPRFDVRVSIEKDPIAHRTLSLRALFRSFPHGKVPDSYYDYVRGQISREELQADPSIKDEGRFALEHARCATLGETPTRQVDQWIREALPERGHWVLIGGPPCQAYSLVGRARMRGKDPKAFEEDGRHFLYKEYLRIIRDFGPSVFVMENVKGILSSTHGGLRIFDRILEDLAAPRGGLEYDIRSFVVPGEDSAEDHENFIVRSEQYGVPQTRHRVILFGVRKDLVRRDHGILSPSPVDQITVNMALSGLPSIRSRISKEPDSHASWLEAIQATPRSLKGWRSELRLAIEDRMGMAAKMASAHQSSGSRFIPCVNSQESKLPAELEAWFRDARLGGVIQHESRSHMRSDLHRYLFAACYGLERKVSPRLRSFPPALLPAHANIDDESVPFPDRFRVQLRNEPSSTVVAHIAKDGHYYIHPDPSQCRSLTVREAARLQTFPDNYFFEGNRTQQYTQVGNAVPPWLARQLADVVARFLV